jgi:hypothetical protein
VGGYRSCSFDCGTGAHSHHGYVSRSPPIIPDGQISRVRFETSAFFRGPSQVERGLKRWFVYAPSFPGLPPASSPVQLWRCAGFIKPATSLAQETAKCPEPLCPTLVLPPLGRRLVHLLRGALPPGPRSYGLMCHSLWALSSFGIEPRSKSLCRSYSAPAAHGSFPTLSLKILPWMLDPVPTAVPLGALTCYFPSVIGLPPAKMESASRFYPRITTSRGSVFSRAADIS